MLPIVLLALGFAQPQGYSLLWKPKPKESHVYALEAAFDFRDGTLVQVKGNTKFLVLEVNAKGNYLLQTSTTGVTTISNGETQSVPDEPPTQEEFNRLGVPLTEQTAEEARDPFANLLDRLTKFEVPLGPVRVGDSWNGTPTKSTHKFAPRIAYTLKSIGKFENKQVEKVTYVASDLPGEATATGTILLDLNTHELVQLLVNIPSFKPDADGPTATTTIRFTEKG